MDTETLIKFMNFDYQTKAHFRGCMPRDFLPIQLKPCSFYVINLSASYSNDSGSHWVLISTMHSDICAYICSLGQKPIHKNVIKSLNSHGSKIIYNDFKNQHEVSTVCGFHVIFTAAMISRGHSLLNIMTQFFTNESYINDHAIVEIISSAHKIKTLVPVFDWNFIVSFESEKKGDRNLISNKMVSYQDGKGKKIIIRQHSLNEKLQKLDGEENQKTGESTNQFQVRKTNTTKGRSKKEITEKKEQNGDGIIKKRGGEKSEGGKKDRERLSKNNIKTIKFTQTKDSNSIISTKVELRKIVERMKEKEQKYDKMIEKIQKKLELLHDLDGVRMVKFLLYVMIKERKMRSNFSSTYSYISDKDNL